MALKAFNGQLDLSEAFKYGSADIHRFLKNVANSPPTWRERDPRAGHQNEPYPDENPNEPGLRKARLERLRDLIIELTRTVTGPKEPVKLVRFLNATTVNPVGPFRWPVTGKEQSFYIIFDLLGSFLSDISPAPTGLDKDPQAAKRFFIALLAVYAQWCFKLSHDSQKKAPLVAQITLGRKDNTHPWFFFLGSTISGYTDQLRQSAQQTRWRYTFPLLKDNPNGTPNEFKTWNVSPVIREKGLNFGYNFGNCGETYPFLYFLETAIPAQNLRGIAIELGNLKKHKEDWGKYVIKPLCANCEYFVREFGASNFTRWP